MSTYRDVYVIEGGNPLHGQYRVRGAKNAALPILAACLCRSGVHEICGCPRIGDVQVMCEILEVLGAGCSWQGDCLTVDSRGLWRTEIPDYLMSKLRSSVFLLGSLLARTGEAVIFRPGGCRIGRRPIDIHLDGLAKLGFSVEEDGEKIICRGTCRGGRIRLPFPSVGATENLMMAALSGCGTTVIENCAQEPEIADLQGFLRTCGFQVYGAGTPVIAVQGGKGTGSAMYFIMEDRIEAATYMMAAAGCGGEILLEGVKREYVQAVMEILEKMGVRFRVREDAIWVKAPVRLTSPGAVTTAPYPGFPTDCQPQLMSLTAKAEGTAVIGEEIFENRFTHKKELVKMGANIETCGKHAIIKGVDTLQGRRVLALDLRGGAALVLAGLMAEGTTSVADIHHIERGYQCLETGLSQLGGKIERRKEKKTEKAGEPSGQTSGSDRAAGCSHPVPAFAGV